MSNVSGGVWRIPPISKEPITELHYWSAYLVTFAEGKPSRHYVGTAWDGGRVCSPIVAYDPKTKTGTTRSGRKYKLVGPSTQGNIGTDAAYVWGIWKVNNKVQDTRIILRQTRLPRTL